jgi:hypothetical protein
MWDLYNPKALLEKAQTMWRDYLNVDEELGTERSWNSTLAMELSHRREFQQKRVVEREEEIKSFALETEEKRKKYEEEGLPLLEVYDRTSIGKLMFDEVNQGVEKDARVVHEMYQDEINNFGYQSKILFSLTLMVEALRAKMFAGKPFHDELMALEQETEKHPDIMALMEPLREVAKEGLRSAEWLTLAGQDAAESIERALETPSTGLVAKSFFHSAKFDLTETPDRKRGLNTHQSSANAVPQHFGEQLSAALDRRNYSAAVHLAVEASKRLPLGTVTGEEALQCINRFYAGAVPVVLAHHLSDYCEASLVTTRFSFVEKFLDEIAKEGGGK